MKIYFISSHISRTSFYKLGTTLGYLRVGYVKYYKFIMGCAKWPHGSGEYFYYWGRPSQTLIHRDIGSFVLKKWPKINKIVCFRVWNMGCPIEWAHGGYHLWYLDRLVNSAVFWSNRAGRPRSVGKLSPFPFQILSFAQGRKNWAPAPPISRLRVIGRRVTTFSTARAFVPVSLRP